MRLRIAAPLILISTLLISIVAIACGSTIDEIVQTTTAEQKVNNATATAAACVASGKPADCTGQVGVGSLAEQVQQTAFAGRTATAEAGGITGQEDLVRLPDGSFTNSIEATRIASGGTATEPLEPPDGPVQSGEVLVEIGNGGKMTPAVIKVAPGTKVIWENQERSAHASASDPGQDETWVSGDLDRKVTEREKKRFEHVFTIPGRYTYGSNTSGDRGRGTVFVIEE